MRKNSTLLFIAYLLLLTVVIPGPLVKTQECFVQIVSVSVNKSILAIGESLQVNITYDLIYDLFDPLAIGAVSVSILNSDEGTLLHSKEFMEIGLGVTKNLFFLIQPSDWSPNETGQNGQLQVDGWVQDSYGSMTDSIDQNFQVEQSEVQIKVETLPSSISFHDTFDINGNLTNPHNDTLPISNQLVNISICKTGQIIQSWSQYSTTAGVFSQPINTTELGTGAFICNITAEPNDDYRRGLDQKFFNVTNADFQLDVALNASSFLTFVPSMKNCTAFVTANITCLGAQHDVQEANLIWNLLARTGNLTYFLANQFVGEVPMPNIPGEYNISITATLSNHTMANAYLPVTVLPRVANLNLVTNQTEAAYGDDILLSVSVLDIESNLPIIGKNCSFYILNQSNWELISQTPLDLNGSASIIWTAQDVGYDNEFTFKVIFNGFPEFFIREENITVINTREIRFIGDPVIETIRGRNANCTIQITTLESVPLSNLTIHLVETSTNLTWNSVITNDSGYAYLEWEILSDYNLGDHLFSIIVYDELELLGSVNITIRVYDETVLSLV